MIINKQPLSDLIAEKSGLSSVECLQFLDQIIDDIKRLKKTKTPYKIEGLGRFYILRDELIFEPTPTFELEINQDFAGLSEVEIAPALHEDEENLEALVPEDNDEPTEDTEAPIDEEVDNEETKENSTDTQLSDEEPMLEKDDSDFDDEMFEDEHTEMNSSQEPEAFEEEEQLNPFEKFRAERRQEIKKNHKRLIITLGVIVVFSLALWYYINLQAENEQQNVVASIEQSGDDNLSVEEDSNKLPAAIKDLIKEDNDSTEIMDSPFNSTPKAAEGTVSGEVESETPLRENEELQPVENTQNNTTVNKPPQNTASEDISIQDTPLEETNKASNTTIRFGLRGGEVMRIANSATIVVHSLAEKAKAETAAQPYIKEGYRVVIFPGKLKDGRVFWRVGLGQFRNTQEAINEREKLSEKLQKNSFISIITFE